MIKPRTEDFVLKTKQNDNSKRLPKTAGWRSQLWTAEIDEIHKLQQAYNTSYIKAKQLNKILKYLCV